MEADGRFAAQGVNFPLDVALRGGSAPLQGRGGFGDEWIAAQNSQGAAEADAAFHERPHLEDQGQ